MRIVFKGTVQGVGFRPAAYRAATRLGLKGGVWNEGSTVVVDVDNADAFLHELNKGLPPLAKIDSLEVIESKAPHSDFGILESSQGDHCLSIPPDTAICDSCIADMESGNRLRYPFSTCTECGPRFSLMDDVPYDRASTSMSGFHPCDACKIEYGSPSDRRFHHQTICCRECGPGYTYMDGSGNRSNDNAIQSFCNDLKNGGIGVIKGWGGMHICCMTDRIQELRDWYHRRSKPFAVMVRDVRSIGRFGIPTEQELKHLTSSERPIVLVEKVKSQTTEDISPGLDNIGLFLPYAGVHHELFKELGEDSLIMTSANSPGDPMIIDDKDVLSLNASMYLVHDQRIANRIDDSVIRTFNGNTLFIRKSRGYVPSYVPFHILGDAISLGAQENIAASIAKGGRIYSTQHIGDGDSPGVIGFLEKAVRSHSRLLDCKPTAVALDTHPGHSNRKVAKSLADEAGLRIVEVQHHWAHSSSLMVEHGLDEIVSLTLDGTGRGDDGNVWGGEVLHSTFSEYARIAHLEGIPLLGSEKALYDLRRLRFAIDETNGANNESFSDDEASILRKIMGSSIRCTSMGRLMDAISFSLGVCSTRTYDGEPAMRLEPLLRRGRLIEGFETEVKDGEVKTLNLFSRMNGSNRREDIAYSMTYNVLDSLIQSAADHASRTGLNGIGLTGGVSYNHVVCQMFTDIVKERGFEPLLHHRIPCGDGGISVGQVAVALEATR